MSHDSLVRPPPARRRLFQRHTAMCHHTDDQDHLTNLIQTSDDAIITKSLDGRVLTWNPAAMRIFGYAA